MASARQTRCVKAALSEKLEKSLQEASDLEDIANRRGVDIVEPFTGVGAKDGAFRILGPSETYYEQLLSTIQAPAAGTRSARPYDWLLKAKQVAWKLVPETIHVKTLRDDGVTSTTNSTSAICLLTIDGRKLLFTGDAGIEALELAVAVLEAEGFIPGDLKFCQIPHHGSRRNVGPSILNRILGPKGQSATHSTAYVSAPPENPEKKHPAKKVTNAFIRRGYAVHATEDLTRLHYRKAPERDGWSTGQPLPFHTQVEEDSES